MARIRGVDDFILGFTDWLTGTRRDDVLIGRRGGDSLIGRGGDDLLLGGVGDDELVADAGRDTLVGGAGDDVFVVQAGAGRVTIRDFGRGADRIDLTPLGVDDVSDVRIAYRDSGAVVIRAAGERIILRGDFRPGDITEDDFRFRVRDVLDAEDLSASVGFEGPFSGDERAPPPGTERRVLFNLTTLLEIDEYTGEGLYAASSGDNVLIKGAGDRVSFVAARNDDPLNYFGDSTFELRQMTVSAGYRDGMTLIVRAMHGDDVIGVRRVKLGDAGELTTIRFGDNFDHVSRVDIRTRGGRMSEEVSRDTDHMSMDDIVFML